MDEVRQEMEGSRNTMDNVQPGDRMAAGTRRGSAAGGERLGPPRRDGGPAGRNPALRGTRPGTAAGSLSQRLLAEPWTDAMAGAFAAIPKGAAAKLAVYREEDQRYRETLTRSKRYKPTKYRTFPA